VVTGGVEVETFAAPPDPAIVDLARRSGWHEMAGHRFPERFEAVVEVELADGTRQHHRVDSVRGAPDRPIGTTEVLAKFRANAARALPEAAVDTVLDACLGLDAATGLNALTAALRCQGQGEMPRTRPSLT